MSWVPPDRPASWPPPGGETPPTGPPTFPPADPGPAEQPTWTSVGTAPSRGRGPATAIMAVAVVLVLAAGLATFLLLRKEVDPTPEAAPPSTETSTETTTDTTDAPEETTSTTEAPEEEEPPPPADQSELEAEVAELSAFVADARGAPFPGPVTVELLEGDAFNERLLSDFEEEREDIDLVGRLFVAVGLLDGDQDLYEIFREFLGAGVLGFYDPETGELVVRGAAITPYTRSTIVHELVHAYDDQRFELDRPAIDDADDESGLAFSSLVEGNAVRIQEAWEAELSDEERESLRTEQLASVMGIDFGAVPLVLLQQIDFPYSSGPAFVDALLEEGGEASVDAAFAEPPTTSEQIIDPDLYLAGEGPLPVPAPPADGEVIDQGSYGQLTLLITLGDVVDRETAREAADGWGGDAYVAWREGEATCVRAAFRMDTPSDLEELVDAWQAWAEEQPDAEVATTDELVTVTACG